MSIRRFPRLHRTRDGCLARAANTLYCLVLIAFPCAVGCTHEVSEEDAHLEHVIPPHKPTSYADTVTQLEVRWSELRQSADAQQLAELGDIVHWLPELAADSDLDRAQWEQVQAVTTTLETLYARLAGDALTDADEDRWQESVAALRELAPSSDEREGQSVSLNRTEE